MSKIIPYELQASSMWELLQKALSLKLLHEQEYARILKDIENVIMERIQLYNRKRTTSISLKYYRQICKSIWYTLDHALPASNPLPYVLKTSIVEQFHDGYQAVKQKYDDVTSLFHRIQLLYISFPNERYNSIFKQQIPCFLEDYDVDYRSYYCHEDLDYPLLDGLALDHQMYQMRGVDLVYEYLQRFLIEMRFTQRFHDEVEDIIQSYEKQKGIEVELLGCNLCEILLNQLLFAFLVPKKEELLCSLDEIDYINTQIKRVASAQKVTDIVFEKLQFFCTKDAIVYSYLKKHKPRFQRMLQTALRNDSLSKLILTNQERPQAIFKVAPTISTTQFLNLLEELRSCNDMKCKIQLLRSSELSYQDYIDVFENELFYGIEFQSLFQTMSNYELAILYYSLRRDDFAFAKEMDVKSFLSPTTTMYEWQEQLYIFLKNRKDSQRNEILHILNHTKIEL